MTTQKIQETRDAAKAAAIDFVKTRLKNGKPASPSVGAVHALMLVHVMDEIASGIDPEPDANDVEKWNAWNNERTATFAFAFAEVENGSAFRQSLEKDGILAKSGKVDALLAELS